MTIKNVPDLHRLLRIITLLESGGDYNAPKLAAEFGTAERTIYRDLEKLKSAGVPVVHDPATRAYRIEREFFLPPVQLTPEEALALAVLCEEVAGREQIGLLAPALKGLRKIQANLPTDLREEIEQHAGRMTIHTARTSPADAYKDVYNRISESIAAGNAVECEYESPRSGPAPEPFLFEPYALHFSVRAWYAIGRHAGRDGIRCLKLSRFTRITPTGRAYTIPEDFNVRDWLRNAWQIIPGDTDHDIEIRFRPPIAANVAETLWHHTQDIEEHPDGSITFRCTVSGLDEIVWWVLQMGPAATVVKPAELAERVAQLAADIHRNYQDPSKAHRT